RHSVCRLPADPSTAHGVCLLLSRRFTMPLTRREFVAASAVGVALLDATAKPPVAKSGMGVLLYSFGIRSRQDKGFSDPGAFAELCRERGAAGVQVSLGTRDDAAAKKLRDSCGELGVFLEGIVRAPTDEKDAERFEAEIRTASACGADVVRTVMSPGRRY